MPDYEAARERFQTLLNQEAAAANAVREAELNIWTGLPDIVKDRFLILRGSTSQETEMRLKDEDCFIYVRTDRSYFAGRGSHQAVVDIGGGLVAKFPFGYRLKEIQGYMETHFPDHLSFGGGTYYRYTKEVIDNLRELGFEVPDIEFCRIYWDFMTGHRHVKVDEKISHGKYIIKQPLKCPYPNTMIMPDLRENGRFTVEEYDDKVVQGLPNSSEVSSQFESGFARLMDLYVGSTVGIADGVPGKKPPYLMNKPHGPDYSPETAIRKMFLLQVPNNPCDDGKLVLGDFDHVLLFMV